MADGEIRIETRVDNSGIPKDLAVTVKELARMTSAFDKQVVSIKKQEAALADMQRKLDLIASSDVQVASLTKMESQLKRITSEIKSQDTAQSDLVKKYDESLASILRMRESGRPQAEIERELSVLNRLDEQLMQSGETLDSLNNRSTELAARLAEIRLNPETSIEALNLADRIALANEQLENSVSSANNLREQLNRAFVPAEESTRRLASNTRSAASHMDRLGASTESAGSSARRAANGFERMAKRLALLIKSVFVIQIIRTALRGLREGLGALMAQNEAFAQSWNAIKVNLLSAFAPIWEVIQPALIVFMQILAQATQILATFIAMLFGKTYAQAKQSAQAIYDQAKAFKEAGAAAKKAGANLQTFDEINQNVQDTSGGAGAAALDFSGIQPIDSAWLDDIATKFKSLLDFMEPLLDSLKQIGKAFIDAFNLEFLNRNIDVLGSLITMFNNIFDGITAGLNKVDFSAILDNLTVIASVLGTLFAVLLDDVLRIGVAISESIGTALEWSIAIVGKLVETLTQGIAQFLENSKEKIILWMDDTTKSVENIFERITSITGNLGELLFNSLEKNRDKIAGSVEGTLTSISDFGMLTITLVTQTIEDALTNIDQFIQDNEDKISLFFDNTAELFTGGLDTINLIVQDTLELIKKNWDDHFRDVVSGVSKMALDIYGWFLDLYNKFIAPVVQRMLDWVKKIWNESLKGVVDETLGFVGRIGELFLFLWENGIKPIIDFFMTYLLPIITEVFFTVVDIIGGAVNIIFGIIGMLIGFFNGLIDFLLGVFTGDWDRAWSGVEKMVDSVWSGIEKIVKGVVNVIVDLVNGMIRVIFEGINGLIDMINSVIKQLNRIPGIDFDLISPLSAPQIPRLKVGLDYVPYDDFPALLHKGERVLTAAENAAYSMGITPATLDALESFSLSPAITDGMVERETRKANAKASPQDNYDMAQAIGEAVAVRIQEVDSDRPIVINATGEWGQFLRNLKFELSNETDRQGGRISNRVVRA